MFEVQSEETEINMVKTLAGSVSRFGSGLFLLIQVVILLDFTHNWNSAWVAKDEQFWWAFTLHYYELSVHFFVNLNFLWASLFLFFSSVSISRLLNLYLWNGAGILLYYVCLSVATWRAGYSLAFCSIGLHHQDRIVSWTLSSSPSRSSLVWRSLLFLCILRYSV